MVTAAGIASVVVVVVLLVVLPSIRVIGPNQVGLVMKRFSWRQLEGDSPIALRGEAGYQADLLMPGWHFKLWIVYSVKPYPWAQVPAGEIGVVISQVGAPLPIGAKSAFYRRQFGNFTDLRAFIANGGEKGVQRPVLPPGSLLPIHPIGFLVLTSKGMYGEPIDPKLVAKYGALSAEHFKLVRIHPQRTEDGRDIDVVGIVETLEGDPLPAGSIASRIGAFDDVREMLRDRSVSDGQIVEQLLGNQNDRHNNYQDFQAFLDAGGKIGLQHDPLLYGAYALNPFLVRVEVEPMLVVNQGEVAVIKSYVGLPTQDTSGDEFKHGSLVRPGHRGIWHEPLRTGKYPLNPRIYDAAIVPTAILTLNWASASSAAHNLDRRLEQIVAKSREAFVFKIDLQVLIHVPDTKAPRVISMVGSMENLVNEVLQSAVGNHFRDKLQSLQAIRFIETRQQVQEDAFAHISERLKEYNVETRGVYIQDVVLPEGLVQVLTQREIAHQEIETFEKQREAQERRVSMEQAKGTADMQSDLAKSAVGVEIEQNNAEASKAKADGESTYISQTGTARGAEVRAIGLANAEAYERQVSAIGPEATAIVNAIKALAESGTPIVPQVLVVGGEGGGSVEALAASLVADLGLKKKEGGDMPRSA
ncbi:MAG: hypothetical protein GF393_02855 [Armatimonadia bacterium]|nr:hypothetical protein [Armatimonadia bacterium]